MIRKVLFLSLYVFFVSALWSGRCFAQTDIYVSGAGKLVPIAVPQMCQEAEGTTAVRDIPSLIARDLDLSGYFEVLNPNAYIESAGKCGGVESVVYSDWTVLGADFIVKGSVASNAGQVRAKMYLVDVLKHQSILGKEYSGGVSDVSLMAHRFANEILKYFTGSYGPFGTQIAFSTRIGRFKELAVMDMDGSNVRQLTNDQSLSMSVAWNPNGRTLIFTSYRNRTPDLFSIDIGTHYERQITRNPELEIAPHFAKDGQRILVSITENGGGDNHIALLDLNGRIIKRITQPMGAIDVSPQWSPDESQIIYCSSRGGGPQIYVMDANGGGSHKVSFATSPYCTSPAWSPKGDKIAYICRAEAGFHLFVANPDGSSAMQLTSYGDNEDPTFSPDGRYIAFSSNFGRGAVKKLALIRTDGSGLKQLTNTRTEDSGPAWGPSIE